MHSQSNQLKLYNVEGSQDDNGEVLGTDILNAAVVLADHQRDFSDKLKNLESTTDDLSSSENVIENGVLRPSKQNADFRDQFLEERAASEENASVSEDNSQSMMIRSVTLTQNGINLL